MTSIVVTTGSRLHFGLICSPPAARWRFGGIGVMLKQPAWRLSVTPIDADTDEIHATDETCRRIREFLERIRSYRNVRSLQLVVHQEMSFHTGLGSGTQLGLALSAVAELITHLHLEEDPFLLARLADRAERSAIGTVGFVRGGFLIDHGESHQDACCRQVDRIALPDNWRFVLIHPVDSQGLSGERERTFFQQHVSMPVTLIENLEQQILNHIAPSLREQRFEAFATSLENYGQMIGAFYAPEQGGVFAHSAMAKLAALLRTKEVLGMAQSSWGPLICIPAKSQEHAGEILRLIPDTIESSRLNTIVSEPLNSGATIRSTVDDADVRSFV